MATKKAAQRKKPAAAKKVAAHKLKTPAKRKTVVDGDVIAKALAKELPGWTRVATRPTAITADTAARAIPGATMKVLRTKFLGAQKKAAAGGVVDAVSGDKYGKPNKKRVTVQVQSASGSVKVADLVRGKMKIVQG